MDWIMLALLVGSHVTLGTRIHRFGQESNTISIIQQAKQLKRAAYTPFMLYFVAIGFGVNGYTPTKLFECMTHTQTVQPDVEKIQTQSVAEVEVASTLELAEIVEDAKKKVVADIQTNKCLTLYSHRYSSVKLPFV